MQEYIEKITFKYGRGKISYYDAKSKITTFIKEQYDELHAPYDKEVLEAKIDDLLTRAKRFMDESRQK